MTAAFGQCNSAHEMMWMAGTYSDRHGEGNCRDRGLWEVLVAVRIPLLGSIKTQAAELDKG